MPPLTWALRWWNLTPALLLVLISVLLLAVLGPVITTPQVSVVQVEVPGPTAILAGLLVALAVSATLKEPASTLPHLANRPIRAWRCARVLLLVALAVTLFSVTAPPHAGAAISCVCALTGEALLLARLLWEEIAWALPLLHAGLTLTFGTDPFGRPHPWAWILPPTPDTTQLTASILLLALGTMLWTARPPHER